MFGVYHNFLVLYLQMYYKKKEEKTKAELAAYNAKCAKRMREKRAAEKQQKEDKAEQEKKTGVYKSTIHTKI
jgi:hypothetical protein